MNTTQQPFVIAPELFKVDDSILLCSPNLLQHFQRRNLNAAEFLDLLKEGLAKGLSPKEWLTELVETGQMAAARRLLRLLPATDLTITSRELNVRSQIEKGIYDKEIERVRERIRRQRAVLAYDVIEDLEYMLEDTRQLIAEEWFNLANEYITEIQRLLDRELAEAMEERRKRFDKAQAIIKPMLEKFIHAESTLRLDATIDVFWELVAYANRLSVDTEGSLELVKETCAAVEALYQGAPPNENLLNKLRRLYDSGSDVLSNKPSAPAKVHDDRTVLSGLMRYPLSGEEQIFLRRIVDEHAEFVLWDLTHVKVPSNVAWNETTATKFKFDAQQMIRSLKSEPTRLLEIFRYLLRYWSSYRKTIPDLSKTYNELKEILWGYAEIKAINLLASGRWDSACEYYRVAFRLRAEAKNFFMVGTQLYHYFSAYTSQQGYPQVREFQVIDPSAKPEFDEALLIQEAMCENLERSKDKTGMLIVQGLMKLAALHPWLLEVSKAALDCVDNQSRSAKVLAAAFERLRHLLEMKPGSPKLGNQLEELTKQYIHDHQQTVKLLSQLWDITTSTRNLSGLKQVFSLLLSPQNLWESTDLALLDEFAKLESELSRYFVMELSFQERIEIANALQDRVIPNFIQQIEMSPTPLGSLYLMRAAENIQSILTQEQAFLVQVSLPVLTVNVEQSEWRSDGNYYCHLNIQNLGETQAENVQIDVDESLIGEYRIVDASKMIGTVYPGKPRSVHIRVQPTPFEEHQSAFALLIRLHYTVAGRNGREERSHRLRIDDFSVERPQFQSIKNPYVVGGPVFDPKLFRGRDQLIDELSAEVANPERTASVVIFGQKRSGKTSVLFHLAQRVPDFIIPIDFDIPSVLASLPKIEKNVSEEQRQLQREAAIGRFLFSLVKGIVRASQKKGLDVAAITWEQLIAKPGPDIQFREFLEQFRDRTDGVRLLLILDEFTALTDKIDEEMIDSAIMRLFKSLIERGYFSCILCGLTEAYSAVKRFANQLAVTKPHFVDYLSMDAAKGLIAEPIQLTDERSRFVPLSIVDEIIDLTAGSPFYIQMFCQRLVQYMNYMKIERVTAADIDEVTRSLIQGRERIDPVQSFDNLYKYKDDPKDSREAVLEGLIIHLLAHETISKRHATVAAIYDHIRHFVSEDDLEKTLAELEQRRTILQEVDDTSATKSLQHPLRSRRYRIRVDLFRHWLVVNRPVDDDVLRSFERKLSNGIS